MNEMPGYDGYMEETDDLLNSAREADERDDELRAMRLEDLANAHHDAVVASGKYALHESPPEVHDPWVDEKIVPHLSRVSLVHMMRNRGQVRTRPGSDDITAD